MQPAMFGYAGTKDKRACTAQRLTAHRIDVGRLAALNKTLKGARLGDFEPADAPLKLGELYGNRFEIVLRDVSVGADALATAMSCLQTRGFINYFGLQRFGSTSIASHHVGIAILKVHTHA